MEAVPRVEVLKEGQVLDVLPLAILLQQTGGSLTFGRGVENDVRIDHGSCSRLHAAVLWKAGKALIKDLKSTHGTTLTRQAEGGKQRPLSPDCPLTLEDGDVVRFGASSRQYRFMCVSGLAAVMQITPQAPLHQQLAELMLWKAAAAPLPDDKENTAPPPPPSDSPTSVSQQPARKEAEGGEMPTPAGAACPDQSAGKPPVPVVQPTTPRQARQGKAGWQPRKTDAAQPKAAQHKAARPRGWVLVIDTNILLSKTCYPKLQRLIGQRRPDIVRVVVPRIVLREMDHLNHGPFDRCAHIRSVLWTIEQEQKLGQAGPSILHMQAMNEPDLDAATFFKAHVRERRYHCNDDYIMEAGHFFKGKRIMDVEEQIMVVTTDDRALRIRARSEGLLATPGADALTNLSRECELSSGVRPPEPPTSRATTRF